MSLACKISKVLLAWAEVTETRDKENKRKGTEQRTDCTVKKKKER